MIKKIIKVFRIKVISSYVYRMDNYVPFKTKEAFRFDLKIDRQSRKRTRYFIEENNVLIHQSYLYSKIFLMRLLNNNGPVIGNCFTHPKYRGQAIYPYVINHVAKNTLDLGYKNVFVIVDQSNNASIKGIEKAGFERYASLDTKRWFIFHVRPKIIYH